MWDVHKHLQNTTQHFGCRYKRLPRRFKKTIPAIGSTSHRRPGQTVHRQAATVLLLCRALLR